MSTQYSVVNKRIIEEVAEFQRKIAVIQAECIRMIRETPVFADLQETKEDSVPSTCFLHELQIKTVQHGADGNAEQHP